LIEINRNPDRGQLRTFGLAGLTAFLLLFGWTWWRQAILGIHLGATASGAVAAALLIAAAAFGVLAFAAPAALKPIFIALSLIGAPIGFCVSALVLGLIYYTILTPIGLFFVQSRFVPSKYPILGAFAFETSGYSKLSDWPGGGVVGVHGTNMPWLIGQAVSHGCVRLRNSDVLALRKLVRVGTPVKIVAA